MRRHYSEEFKSAMVKRMIGPPAISGYTLSKEVGVSEAALYRWLNKAKARGIANGNMEQKMA